jgi:hypothetical protein
MNKRGRAGNQRIDRKKAIMDAAPCRLFNDAAPQQNSIKDTLAGRNNGKHGII